MRITFRAADRSMINLFLLFRTKRLWATHGPAILAAYQELTGLAWTQGATVVVHHREQDPTNAHKPTALAGFYGQRAIRLYLPQSSTDFSIIWTLAHELGHRHLHAYGLTYPQVYGLHSIEVWYELEHRLLFLVLFDVMERALGYEVRYYWDVGFAINPSVDGHARAQQWAKGLSFAQRQHLMRLYVSRGDLQPVAQAAPAVVLCLPARVDRHQASAPRSPKPPSKRSVPKTPPASITGPDNHV